MIAETKSGIEVVKQASGLILGAYDRYKLYKELSVNDSVYLRMIYLEIRHNIELLEAVNLSSLKDTKINEKGFSELLNSLSVDIMGGVFYLDKDNKADRLYKLLKKKGTIHNKYGALQEEQSDGSFKTAKHKELEESILKTIVFVVAKIDVLKKLSQLKHGEYLKGLRLKTRLVNIRQRLLMLNSTFSKMKEIEDMVK